MGRSLDSTTMSKVEILKNNGGLPHKCMICGSVFERKLNNMYMLGHSMFGLAKMFDFDKKSVMAHLKALGLVVKRRKSTLTVVQRILKNAKKNYSNPSDQLVAKAMELQAKLTGELDERNVTNIGIAVVSEVDRKKRMAEGLNRFGVEIKNDQETE